MNALDEYLIANSYYAINVHRDSGGLKHTYEPYLRRSPQLQSLWIVSRRDWWLHARRDFTRITRQDEGCIEKLVFSPRCEGRVTPSVDLSVISVRLLNTPEASFLLNNSFSSHFPVTSKEFYKTWCVTHDRRDQFNQRCHKSQLWLMEASFFHLHQIIYSSVVFSE